MALVTQKLRMESGRRTMRLVTGGGCKKQASRRNRYYYILTDLWRFMSFCLHLENALCHESFGKDIYL